MGKIANKYCALSALKNESDVEQFFILPMLADLVTCPPSLVQG